jgi:hypothetical protein
VFPSIEDAVAWVSALPGGEAAKRPSARLLARAITAFCVA